jgi:tetratricopeptide (TPR) repeat protein
MAVKVIDLRCSGCGGALAPSEHFCKFCGNAVVVSSFNSIYAATAQDALRLARTLDRDLAANPGDETRSQINATQAFCYLKLKRHDEALARFKAAAEDNFDNPEPFFYAAVCLLRGKKAFLASLADIKDAIGHINSALMMEDRGVFHYFLAYIKHDFHARRCLRVSPDWQAELAAAHAAAPSVSPADADMLFATLGVERPAAFVF